MKPYAHLVPCLIAFALAGCGGGTAPASDMASNAPADLAMMNTGGDLAGPCSAANCATGCCMGLAPNTTCQPGTNVQACGIGGIVCGFCSSWQICGASQDCEADPLKMWKIQPFRADLNKDNMGKPWDLDGSKPDAKVRMYCPAGAGMATATTEVSLNTESAAWTMGSCMMTAADLLKLGFEYEVLEDDMGSDEVIAPKTATKPKVADLAGGLYGVGAQGGLMNLAWKLSYN